MKSWLLVLAAFLMHSLSAIAQQITPADDKQAYQQTINARAEKIVATLSINDTVKASQVKKIIAGQYKNLNDIYAARDVQIKAVNEHFSVNDKEAVAQQVGKIKDATKIKTDSLHKAFISTLSKNLVPLQVEKVKDGITYNVLHVTYNAYNQMILTLTQAQQKQMMDWLIEAREIAMDAESADKKHEVFGKYKGRINNYLSANGYDLKKEREEWQKRIKENEVGKN